MDAEPQGVVLIVGESWTELGRERLKEEGVQEEEELKD